MNSFKIHHFLILLLTCIPSWAQVSQPILVPLPTIWHSYPSYIWPNSIQISGGPVDGENWANSFWNTKHSKLGNVWGVTKFEYSSVRYTEWAYVDYLGWSYWSGRNSFLPGVHPETAEFMFADWDSSDSWVWLPSGHWIWTDPESFPWVFSHEFGWTYLLSKKQGLKGYSLRLERWIEM